MPGAESQSGRAGEPGLALALGPFARDVDSPPTREHLRDLAALLSLPRIWRGRSPSTIASSLLDVLVTLLRLDLATVRLDTGPEDDPFEDCRPVDIGTLPGWRDPWPAASDSEVVAVPTPLGAGTMRLVRIAPQLDAERAVVIAGSTRPDFPTDLESFLCRIAVDQAVIAIHASRLVANLEQANAAKASFLATMSHELRTPLNAIIGYSELLRAEIAGTLNGQQQQHVHRIEAAARHLMGLIEGILSFARVEAGKERVNAGPAAVGEIVEGVIVLVEPLAKARALDLDVACDCSELQIHTDSAKVRQILLNLLSNAVKFTSRGRVSLHVRADGSDVEWRVTDTGVGIAERDLARIFEPFSQVGSKASRAPGTGLGLSVSRQLARLLGGDVTGESRLGHGSVFTLRLPQRLAPDADGRGESVT